MITDFFNGRLGLQQRVLPSYRAAFVDTLAKACRDGLSVFAGEPLAIEGIDPVDKLQIAQYVKAKNKYISNPSSSLFVCWQGGFWRWLETWQPDALIVEANPRYLATRRAIQWMHQKGRKVIGWGLGAPLLNRPLASIRQWERSQLLRSMDAIVAYSKQGAAQYRKLGLPSERVFVASNAVDPAPTTPAPFRPFKFDGRATILFVGRLQSRKRVDNLLQACAALPNDLQPQLIIIGDGPGRGEFENLAHQIYSKTEFVGAKYGADLEVYFAKADLFVLPGTGGLAIQQAMAHGLPIIVARGDGTQDDLVRDENGWQIPADDPLALTNILRQALSDPLKLRKMGDASFRIVSEEINVDQMVKVFIEVLNKVSME
jgi:glycosyltransferase involved in cell wall biosynthesis